MRARTRSPVMSLERRGRENADSRPAYAPQRGSHAAPQASIGMGKDRHLALIPTIGHRKL